MTHEELLAKISDLGDNCLGIMAGAVMSDALRAVVELHKPCEIEDYDDEIWYYCEGCSNSSFFPWKYCPSIQAIEKELG